jgi:antitoxin (DNA-binding transcriptional repressor) of toxin-antitoxin stability system
MYNIMVKATSRAVNHAFARYLDQAHDGQQIVITKRVGVYAPLSFRMTRGPVIVSR